jgi:MFS family permease
VVQKSDPDQNPKSPRSLRAFRHRNFRILFAANLVSNIGTWAQRVAQDWLVVTDLHKSGTVLGLVTGLQFLPSLMLSLYSGSLADRYNKRTLLYITNIGGGLTAAILGLLVISNRVTLFEVYLLAFALGVFSALDAPVRQAFTSEVVGKSDIGNAISLNSANFNAGRMIGPAISGLLIKAFHTGPSFLLNAASFVGVIIALASMRKSELVIPEVPTEKPRIADAIRYVRSRPDIIAVMVTIFFAATFGLNFQIFNALMAVQIFHKDAGQYGALGSILAIGSLSAAIISARLDKRRNPGFIMKFAMAFGFVEALLSLMPHYGFYAAFLPICGLFALTTMISANTFVQTTVPAHLRGRVMGLYLLIFMGGTPFGAPLVGWLADLIGVRESVAACGLMTSLAAVVIYFVAHKRLAEFSAA